MKYHFNTQAQLALSNAKKIAKQCQNNYIGTEHLLLGICMIEESKLAIYLEKQGCSYQSIMDEVVSLFGFNKEATGKIEYTATVEELMQDALIVAYQNQLKLVDLDTLSLCLLQAENNVANQLLVRHNIDVEDCIQNFKIEQSSILDKFKELKNLNSIKRKEPIHIVEREIQIQMIIDTLCRKQKANPLLVGEAGVGKSALVEELALLIVENNVPAELKDCIIYELNLNSLVAGTKYRGEFEEKIQKLLDTVLKFPNVILFIDEIHMMIHAGKAEGSIDVAGVLKPYLARGSLRCIGATTFDEYLVSIDKDRALKRRFQMIKIDEPSIEDVRKMILSKKTEYEQHHQVQFPEKLVDNCIEYSRKYLPHLTFPDKSIDVLDLSCVKAKLLKKKMVDEDCLKMAIESLSQIPLSFYQKIKANEKRFIEYCDKAEMKKLLDRLQIMDKDKNHQGPKDIWYLVSEDEKQKRQFSKLIAKTFLNLETELILIDGETCDLQQIDVILQKLKKNPFQIIYIENYQSLSGQIQYIVKEMLEQGRMLIQDQNCDASFCLFLIDSNPNPTKHLGFLKSVQQESENHFFIKIAHRQLAI